MLLDVRRVEGRRNGVRQRQKPPARECMFGSCFFLYLGWHLEKVLSWFWRV